MIIVILAQCAVATSEPNNAIMPAIVEPNRFLTLKDYISYAEAHNAGLKSSYQQWVAATEEVVQAKTLPDPQLTYGYYMPDRIHRKADGQRNTVISVVRQDKREDRCGSKESRGSETKVSGGPAFASQGSQERLL